MLARGMWRNRSLVALLAVAGCGSQTANPPAAEPPRSPPLAVAPAGEPVAVVDRRARGLVVGGARAPGGGGAGPAAPAGRGYVTHPPRAAPPLLPRRARG